MESKSALKKKILENGGSNVVIPQNEYFNNMIERGKIFDGNDAVVVENDDYGLCDYNSSKFYLENDDIKICTGYSLNNDSEVWTRHTWCVDDNDIVYECTPIIRDKYYGIVLNEEETKQFISNWKLAQVKEKVDKSEK